MTSEGWSTISKHAAIRARQRGYSQDDIRFVIEHGTEVPDGYLLRLKDVRLMLKHNKLSSRLLMERAMKLAGTFVPITPDGHAASVYRPCSRKCKHLLHGRRSAGRPHGRRKHR
ncbi:hypothetical protein J2Z50_004013 [Ensifer mexicanus]|nr:hypothetical protein [Sinorhizobium mexicanum]